MNEALRLLKKALKPFGYDLKQMGNFTLLPPQKLGILELTKAYKNFDSIKPPLNANLNELTVFIRTCLRDNRNVNTTPRFTGVSLAETVYTCLASTVSSINHAVANKRHIHVVVLDDHSDQAYVEKLNTIFSELTCSWEMRTTQKTGQGLSLLEQFETAKSLNTLCYFCEDDYLHTEKAIIDMWDFYTDMAGQTNSHLVIHPQEMEFLYNTYYPSYLLKGRNRHWRTMSHATHVFWTHGHVINQYWEYFENTRFVGDRKKRHLGSENNTTNKLFQHIPGFCPIPAVAGHAQFDFTLPPFFDWEALWKQHYKKI